MDVTLFSPPFYSHPGGYKLRFEVTPVGYFSGHNTHLSVFISVLRGEYDHNLQWPFKGDILIEMYKNSLKRWDHSEWIRIEGVEQRELRIN